MKMYASVYRRSAISLAAAVVSLGIPWSLAVAVGTLSNSPPATVPMPQTAPAATVNARSLALPLGVSEVVKMYQAGISKAIIVGYIENSVLPFHLTADGEIYLQRLGVPQEVMLALIHRDGELQRQAAMAYQQQRQQAATTAAANNQVVAGNPDLAVATPGTPPPVVPDAYPYASAPVVYPDYGAYSYYGYPFFYGPDVFIGGGFGFEHGRHFGRGDGRFGHGGGGDRRFGGGGAGRGGFGGGRGGGRR
jgi:hypothetical protein